MESKIGRIEIQLKSDNVKPLSGWQLQEFINNINKGYSKLDLINEISKLLNEGENPENIIIINKSYEINNTYSYLKKANEIDLNKDSMVEKFYNLGRPISMYPNEFIKKIEIIFNLYEKLFSLFRSNKIPTISKRKLKTYINLDFNDAITLLKRDAEQIIREQENIDSDKSENLKRDANELVKKSIENYKNYRNADIKIKEFNELVNKEFKQLNDEEKVLFIDMEKNYYNKFFKALRDVDRPIILKYDEKNNKMSVVKKEYMLNDIESNNFLDYKDYSHNSPFVVTIIAGIIIIPILALLYKGIKQEKLNEEKEKELELQEEKLNNEMRSIIMQLAESEELNQVKQVQNNFLKNKLLDADERVKKHTKTTLKQKGVMNNNIVINFAEERAKRTNSDDKIT